MYELRLDAVDEMEEDAIDAAVMAYRDIIDGIDEDIGYPDYDEDEIVDGDNQLRSEIELISRHGSDEDSGFGSPSLAESLDSAGEAWREESFDSEHTEPVDDKPKATKTAKKKSTPAKSKPDESTDADDETKNTESESDSDEDSGMKTLAALEKLHGISKDSTVQYHKEKKIIALKRDGSWKFPIEQFADGKPLPEIAQLLSIIGNQEKTWEWLILPNKGAKNYTPLTVITSGHGEVMVKLAQKDFNTVIQSKSSNEEQPQPSENAKSKPKSK